MLNKIISLAFIPAALLLASAAHGASTLSLVSSGNSSYQLQATGVEDAAGLDITLLYDPAVLINPRVAQGPLLSGAMLAVNPNTPGTLRISAVTLSPVRGSGTLFTITFTRNAVGQGIRTLAARLIDMKGRPLASQVRLAVGPDTGREESAAPDAAAPRQQTVSGGGPAPAGTVSGGTGVAIIAGPSERPVVQEDRKQVGRKPGAETGPVEPAAPEPASAPRPKDAAADGQPAKSKPVYTQPSILERFRDFRGGRTMKACMTLFGQEQLIGFRQEPAVVLADGSAKVVVRFISTPEREHTTDLALMGAKLVSSRRDPEASNTWNITLLPEKGADRVTLSVPQKDLLMVFPVTVAPKVAIDLDKSGAVNEADFELFLKKRGTAKKPRFDLNRDGKRDYIDDYIFMANYVAGAGKARKRSLEAAAPRHP